MVDTSILLAQHSVTNKKAYVGLSESRDIPVYPEIAILMEQNIGLHYNSLKRWYSALKPTKYT